MLDLILEGTVRERVVKAGELSHPHAFVFPIQAEVQLDGWERRSRDGNVGSCHPFPDVGTQEPYSNTAYSIVNTRMNSHE